MLKKLLVQPQLEMIKTVLTSFIHPDHGLCKLARKIDDGKPISTYVNFALHLDLMGGTEVPHTN